MNLAFYVPSEFKEKVLALLRRYWADLEDGSAKYHLPDPTYQWRHYSEAKQTLDHARAALTECDVFWEHNGNLAWANANRGKPRGQVFDAGPGLSRLPDAALMALWQELDGLYADEVERQAEA